MVNATTVQVCIQFVGEKSDGKTMVVEVFSGGPRWASFTIGDSSFLMEDEDMRELASTLLEALKI